MFYYFGYGSNLSVISLRAKGVVPVRSEPASLEGWSLRFNLPNFFPIEGGVGNIVPDSVSITETGTETSATSGVVHGVLHLCHDGDLASLDELEAEGIAYERKVFTVSSYDGRKVEAFVYVARPELLDDSCKPSKRYKNILVQGAKQMRFPSTVVAELEAIETIDHPVLPTFHPNLVCDKIFTLSELAKNLTYTSLASYVFDMAHARPEHANIRKLFGGRDVTLFMLKRMDSSSGNETLLDVVHERLSSKQRIYLNDYLHEFSREYRLVGRIRIDLSDLKEKPELVLGSPAAKNASGGDDNDKNDLPAVWARMQGAPTAPDNRIAARRVVEDAQRTNKALGHENLGFLSFEHGYMPASLPETELPKSHKPWDEAAASLPVTYRDLSLRSLLDTSRCFRVM